MASIFRKSAIERLSSPDSLDCMIKVTTPLSWVGILTAGIVSILVIAWSFVGSIPTTVSANGFLVGSYSTNTVFGNVAGRVTEIYVREGERVVPGMPLLSLADVMGRDITVYAGQQGVVSSVLIAEEEAVTINQELFRLSPDTANALSAVCYVSLDMAKQLQAGMEARIYLGASGTQGYDTIDAVITNVDSYVSSNTAIRELLGADMANALTANSLPVAVTCELKEFFHVGGDGSYVSDRQDQEIMVSGGEQAMVQIILDKSAPIAKVFPFLGGD